MHRTFLVTAAATASALALATTALTSSATAAPQDASAPSGYVVVLEDSMVARSVANLHADRFGLDLGHVYSSALQGYSATMTPQTAALVEALPGVDFVQPERQLTATAQETPTGVDRAEADVSPTAAIDGTDQRVDVDVAVIDTGVDLDHPDLNVNTAGAKNCTLFGIGNADDGNGHGSHVAGTIGALDDTNGVVGVAPGARIWPVKVLNAAGSGTNADVICGIDYVAAHADEIEVANMSLGGGGEDDGSCGASSGDAMHAAICEATDAGVTFVVAAGNESADAATSTPAAYDEVITVSALADFDGAPGGAGASTCRADEDDTFASFSNFGQDVDIIAPGVCIDSTSMQGGYATLSGTSMAAPHVAGGAALHAATHPGATPSQVKAALLGSGSSAWNDVDDPDSTKEPLLDVSTS
ncbi:S8 family peptidase [Nocardioides euryhalodurans]|uniref:Peptidase S8 n=1 Tax=Nocardioides euryhalodurans TaxID=2518370 RepID=A0A4P7GMF5_9ACTN|nr:S8 family peptidase [Nocardioides euryhalodurans]QBR93338.1 peptidase S8 [Nocardioides euryhalodurans]